MLRLAAKPFPIPLPLNKYIFGRKWMNKMECVLSDNAEIAVKTQKLNGKRGSAVLRVPVGGSPHC